MESRIMGWDPGDSEAFLRRAAGGDRRAWDVLFERYRERLVNMVRLRLDRRAAGRLDASDVVQETYLEAVERLPRFLASREVSFYVWLRFLTRQRILAVHRRELGAKRRDAARDVRLGQQGGEATSAVIPRELAARWPSPSEVTARRELRDRFELALTALDPLDVEILALRHFEALTNQETARELGIEESAASKRYTRALRRVRALLHGA